MPNSAPDPAFFKRDDGVRGCSLFEQAATSEPVPVPSVAVSTSEDAAELIRADKSGRIESWLMILGMLSISDFTAEEMRQRSSLPLSNPDYQRPRLGELEAMHCVVKCDGEEGRPLRERLTIAGRARMARGKKPSLATAYMVTDLGREQDAYSLRALWRALTLVEREGR